MAQVIGWYCFTLAALLLVALIFSHDEHKSDEWQLRRSIAWVIHAIMTLAAVIAFK